MSASTAPLSAPSGTAAAIIQSGAGDDQMRFWLALTLVIGFFAYITFASIFPSKLPGDTLGTIVGYISGFVSAVVMFFFGSSSGSKLKTMQGAKGNA